MPKLFFLPLRRRPNQRHGKRESSLVRIPLRRRQHDHRRRARRQQWNWGHVGLYPLPRRHQRQRYISVDNMSKARVMRLPRREVYSYPNRRCSVKIRTTRRNEAQKTRKLLMRMDRSANAGDARQMQGLSSTYIRCRPTTYQKRAGTFHVRQLHVLWAAGVGYRCSTTNR
jgi:hypothetical protein